MKNRFPSYLYFSKKERIGTVVLLLVCATAFLIPEVAHQLRPPRSTDFTTFEPAIQAFRQAVNDTETPKGEPIGDLFYFDPNVASFDDFVRLGLSEKVANIICNYRDKGGKFRSAEDFQKIWSLQPSDYARLLPYIRLESAGREAFEPAPEKPPVEVFAFDPNTASEADLQRLGLPSRTAKSILNYRSKGGVFRKKEDLQKIYTLTEEDYERLKDYITLSAPMTSAETFRPATYAGGAAAEQRSVAKGPVDINRSSVEDWARLPGMADWRARSIVNFRERLGGFASLEQVAELREMPDSIFQKIKTALVVDFPIYRKLNLNTASAEDLDAHPFFTRKQAEIVLNYRSNHGNFATAAEIAKIKAFEREQAWVAKVLPYLSVE
jgi:DNA uptake protein ComE-like DNA-binding protein